MFNVKVVSMSQTSSSKTIRAASSPCRDSHGNRTATWRDKFHFGFFVLTSTNLLRKQKFSSVRFLLVFCLPAHICRFRSTSRILVSTRYPDISSWWLSEWTVMMSGWQISCSIETSKVQQKLVSQYIHSLSRLSIRNRSFMKSTRG